MAWNFETDPEFPKSLGWADTFVSEEAGRLPVWGGLSFTPSDGAPHPAFERCQLALATYGRQRPLEVVDL
ncbi:MAG TPA: hypothetical protein VNC61_03315 [Acidimicrobiales bacterium]|nr:hypothetical protein [Acidimicrobiales bacterium]